MSAQMLFLAGGRGTRLGEHARNTPKPLLPVQGKPFLRILIEEARSFGVNRVILLAGHLGEQVRACFEETPVPGVSIDVIIEETARGTGGALLLAREMLADRFYLANGDSYFGFPLTDLAAIVTGPGWKASVALRHVEDCGRYGAVTCQDGVIKSFAEKSASGPGLINGGVYYLAREILDDIPDQEMVSLESDVFPALVRQNVLHGLACKGPFIDIGLPESLAEARAGLTEMLAEARRIRED